MAGELQIINKGFDNKIAKYDIKDLVIKDGDVLQWIFKDTLDRYQKDLYNYCISLIKPTDDPSKAFSALFDVSGFCKKHNISSSRTYKRHFFDSIEKIIKESPRVWVTDEKSGKGFFTNIFPEIVYDKKKGIAKVTLSNYIYASFIKRKISIGSLRYTLDDLTALKTFNSTILIDCILGNHVNNKMNEDGYYVSVQTIEELAKMFNFNLTAKNATADFKRNVISTAIKDLNSNSSIEITKNSPITIKNGRKIIAYEFHYKFKENKLSPVILQDDPQLKLFSDSMISGTIKSLSQFVDKSISDSDIGVHKIPDKEITLQEFKREYNIIGKGWQRLVNSDKVYLFKLYVYVNMRHQQEIIKNSGKLATSTELSKYINWCTSHESTVKISQQNLTHMLLDFNMNIQAVIGGKKYEGFQIKTPFQLEYM